MWKMIFEGYTLIFPNDKYKMGIGTINRLPVDISTEKLISGDMPVYVRFLNIKGVNSMYNVRFSRGYFTLLMKNIKKGFQYNHYKVEKSIRYAR